MVRCNSCGGTYEPTQADGTKYFHVCPAISVAELNAAVLGLKVTLPIGETAAIAVTRRTYERTQKRDERPSGMLDAQKQPIPISVGKGVTDLGVVSADGAPVKVDV